MTATYMLHPKIEILRLLFMCEYESINMNNNDNEIVMTMTTETFATRMVKSYDFFLLKQRSALKIQASWRRHRERKRYIKFIMENLVM